MYMIAEVSQYVAVASFAEAWIEIQFLPGQGGGDHVASFAEAWIEITQQTNPDDIHGVASFAEAWIEISLSFVDGETEMGRLLRGGVD